MTLGELVKKYRTEHELSLRDFSRLSGISNGYISMLEKNEHPKTKKPIVPSIEKMKCIASAMNMSLNSLLDVIDGDQEVSIKLEPIQKGIGKRIRSLREFNKLSQTELAIKVGYKDKTSIAKIEAGKVDLPQSKIFAFAKNLGTTPSYILGDNEFPNYVEEKHSFINDNDKTILDKYHQLNDKGKQRLLERADELIELGYVTKGDVLKEA